MCVEASVENGKVTVNETDAASRAVVATRAKSNLKLVTVNNAQKVYSLVEISDSYGKPGDINGLIEDNKVISSKFINNVQKACLLYTSSGISPLISSINSYLVDKVFS